MNFARIIIELELNKQISFGGMYKKNYITYFEKRSIRYEYYSDCKLFKNKINKYSISLVSIKKESGSHVFCIIKINKKYYTLNYHGSDNDFMPVIWSKIEQEFLWAFGIL